MAIDSVAGLIDVIRACRLLEPAQLNDLAGRQEQFGDPRALARELLRRGWLTAYQVNQLFRDQGSSLVLGQYVLLERLGEGGMGQVFKARHQRLERAVALKLIRPERLASQDAVQRFQREARAAARLSHPNIVTIYDADEYNGTHFFAMECVEGTDLARLVKERGPLPVAQACEYIRQGALGLQHAHEQGLVHRDIKPGNLFLAFRADGSPLIKVLDMGLARLSSALEAGSDTDMLTAEGAVMGTPDYIAPEQAINSRTVDIRADIYSLGCTLYFLLTGRPPFPGGSLAEKLLKHQQSQPRPVEQLRPEVPAALAGVLRKLMAKRSADRYQTPAEVAAALAPFCHGAVASGAPLAAPLAVPVSRQGTEGTEAALAPQAVPVVVAAPAVTADATLTGWPSTVAGKPVPASRVPKRHLRLAVAGAVLLLLVGLAVVLWPRGTKRGDRGGESEAAWPLDNLEPAVFTEVRDFDWPPKGLVLVLGGHRGRHWGPVRAVAWSRDGKLVASAGDDGLVCVWKADTLEEYRLLRGHTGPVLCLAFTPDGRLLSGGEDRTIRLWDVKVREELRKLEGHTDRVSCLAVSRDGKRALSGAGGGVDHALRLWDLTEPTRKPRRLVGHTDAIQSVAFFSDDRVLSGSDDGTLRLWRVSTAEQLRRYDASMPVRGLAVSPNGNQAIGCSGGNPWVRVWDLKSGKVVKAFDQSTSSWSIAVSPNGRSAVFGAGEKDLRLINLETGRVLRSFEGHTGMVSAVTFSSDGRRVLSGGADGTVRLWDIESGKEVVPRPGHTFALQSVALSGDGRYVLTGGADKTVRLWDLASNPAGREVRRFEPQHGGTVRKVALSPDGRRGLSCGDDGTARLWDIDSGRERRRFEHRHVVSDVALSPDGQRVFSSGTDTLRFWNPDTGKEEGQAEAHVVDQARECCSVACSLNGRVVITGHLFGYTCVWDAGSGKSLRQFVGQPPTAVWGVAILPDGKHILAGSADGAVRLWQLGTDGLQQPKLYPGLTREVTSVACAPDGKTVAASARDGKVIVWDVATRKPRQQWQLPGAVHGVAFDRHSRHLALANANGTVFILRLVPAETSQ
jgi:WD40 repeat protein/tRNA A-37 threonylcarbamoyl transferase component Bud32